MSSTLSLEWSLAYEDAKCQYGRARRGEASCESRSQLQARVQQLVGKLKTLSSAPIEHNIAPSELSRRQVLVDNLKRQCELLQGGVSTATGTSVVGSGGSDGDDKGGEVSSTSISVRSANGSEPTEPLQTQSGGSLSKKQQVIQKQEELILDIGAGVDRLRANALLINDEVSLHTRLLDDFDSDVGLATAALQAEANRASQIKERTNLYRLYVILAIEAFILAVLLFAWITRGY